MYCVVCFNARNPALCKATTVCSLKSKDQLCGGRKYLNNRGQIRYELGCVPAQICKKTVITNFSLFNNAKPDDLDQIKCCDSDLCNHRHTLKTDVTTRIHVSNPAKINKPTLSPVFSSKASAITRPTYDSLMKYSQLLSKSGKSTNLEKFKLTSKAVFETTDQRLSEITLKTTVVPFTRTISKTTAELITKLISNTKVVTSNKMIHKTTVVPISSTGWLRVPVHNTKWIHIPG
ncbi:unnamed protein product [Mytilus edulis]|uniref:Activin types I and II receptor domain-containing protein n=1 Tax=Mytilus edulis TaxID=6550 RepID=A0A8S3QMB6_MYTED|nr:unnamed protein product [Mytilus edulis]